MNRDPNRTPDPAEPPVRGPVAAFWAGMRETRPTAVLVLVATFVGLGGLAHDLGFSLGWAILWTVLIWAGPAQILVATMLASGISLVAIALAVALSAVRLLPMAVSVLPLVRTPRTRTLTLMLVAHFIAVTVWVESLRLLPGVAREDRASFVIGIGTLVTAACVLATIVGWSATGVLPVPLAAGMLFLTPMFFLLAVIRNASDLSDGAALVIGLAIEVPLALFGVPLDLLWCGLGAGTAAFLIQNYRERRA